MAGNRNSKVQHGAAMPVADRGFVPAADEAHVHRADLDSVRELSIPKRANYIMMQARDQNIRYTLDGSTPTADLGFELISGDPPTVLPIIHGRTKLRFLEEAATASLEFQYGE